MTDVVVGASLVAQGADALITRVTWGGTITQGMVVALDTSDGLVKACDVDSATAALRIPLGIALTAGASGQVGLVQTQGLITLGSAVLVKGGVYVASDAAGGISPVADKDSGDYVATLGIATTTSILDLRIHSSGVNGT